MSQSLLSALLSAVLLANSPPGQAREAAPVSLHWLSSWGTSLMVPDTANELAADNWRDGSLRQIVPLSAGGQRLRVRISNLFGTAAIRIGHASVALALAAGNPDLDAASLRELRFAGRRGVTIPAGAEYLSDPVALVTGSGASLAVTLHALDAPARQTGHPGARTHSFFVKGDKVMDAAWSDAGKVPHWYQLADVEVEAPASVGALVAMGDSITDGYGVPPDTDQRWTDALVRRLADAKTPMAVINGGIGGGRMLKDGLGPNLMARFEREVMGRSGVTHALVLIGVNDLGVQHRNREDTPEARKALVDELMDAHRQIVERAHTRGICVIGATVAPYTGSDYFNPGPLNDADRQVLNAWIRGSTVFDAVADVDAALRDPVQPERLLATFDSGDHLHPNMEGYRRIAGAVPLLALRSCAYRR